ncbi:MAG: nucleoside kinase [Oscillospiraceae bacterium]|nr:nucleoside kinase [Oscillospiraceae bacterium]
MRCISIERLNEAARSPEEIIAEGERLYSEQLSAAAESIYSNRETHPVVLLSGPSGSGKTTSAHRIADLLGEYGCKAHIISMDNYFLPMSENEAARDENGKIDFESPYRLDIPLFKEHLEMLSRCEEIYIPSFDFAKQERFEGMTLKREAGELVILEGIHALNPLVTGDCDAFTTCVYVSVRTRISNGEKLLHPSKIRLMRRLMRDKLYRGRSLEETFEFFKSVERGEDLYIMPFKFRADFDIDTFIEYEALVYRDILLPELEKAAAEYSDYKDYADIEEFLRLLKPVDKRFVPENSLIREFIGE